ncbi:MAG: hypothetical protein PWP04_1382 [Candidatus Atribacteria bacterium]|nr:hypothetical protein [Candidatus Atribacteria bacterium]
MRILPMKTNLFDRIFIGLVVMFGGHLLWVRFVEAYLPLYVCTVVTLAFLIALLING